MAALIHSVYTILLALWVGGISLFTFIVTPEIFRSFSRDEAGKIVGKLFPGYFLFTLVLSVLALPVLMLCRPAFTQEGFLWSLVLSFIAVAVNVFVSLGLHPELRRVKQEIHSFESLADNAPARKKFRRLHALSAMLNILLLSDGVILLLIDSSIKR